MFLRFYGRSIEYFGISSLYIPKYTSRKSSLFKISKKWYGWNMVVNMGKTKTERRVRMVCVRPDQLVMSIVVVYSSSFLRAWYYFNLFYSMQCNILWRDLYLSSHPIENETNIFFFNVLQRCSSIERRMGVNSFSKKKNKKTTATTTTLH